MTRCTAALLSVLAIVSTLVSGAALAENRVALVIGNSSYRTVTALRNPANDASAIAGILTNAGFEVMSVSDVTQGDLRRAIRDFAAKVTEKGADSVALVFYAGHGLQVDGENFLVPVDARIEREADVAIETMRLADVMNALATVPAKIRIVMLDACRNNPFEALGKGGRGLAIVDAPTGSIVAYSTAPGSEAQDGAGRNSPYTAAFLKVVKQPELQIEQLFKRVRLLVNEATDGKQIPWESSSLTSDFWFFPVSVAPAKKIAVAPPASAPQAPAATPQSTPEQPAAAGQPPAPAAVAQLPTAEDLAKVRELQLEARKSEVRTRPVNDAYDLVIEEDDVLLYSEFLAVYPNDPLAERIRRLLARRQEAIAWRTATVTNTPQAYDEYLSRFSSGDYAIAASRLKVRPRLRPIDPIFIPRVTPRIASRPAAAPVVRTAPAPVARPATAPVAPVTAPPKVLPKAATLPKELPKATSLPKAVTPQATPVPRQNFTPQRASSAPRILSSPRGSGGGRGGGGGGRR